MSPSPVDSDASSFTNEKKLYSYYNGSNMDKPLPIAQPSSFNQKSWPLPLESEGLQVLNHSTLEHNGPYPVEKYSPGLQAPEAYNRTYRDTSPLDAQDTAKLPYYHEIYKPQSVGPNDLRSWPLPHEPVVTQPKKRARTCGLRRRTFWFLFATIAIIITIGAVGGGVAGVLTHQQSENSQDASVGGTTAPALVGDGGGDSAPASVSEPAAATTTILNPTPSPSSSTLPELLRDCPSSNNTVYTVALGSAEQQFRKTCSAAYTSIKTNDENFIEQPTESLNDCIQLCAQWNINSHESPAGEPQPCNSVCWRNTYQGGLAGTCYGFAVTILPGETAALGNLSDFTACDSALWINEPSAAESNTSNG